MPSSELISLLRTKSNALDVSVRFLVLDLCDRLERKTRDCELLAQKIVELRQRAVKTNADRIRAMSDEELAKLLLDADQGNFTVDICDERYCVADQNDCPHDCKAAALKWLQQPMEVHG